LLMEMKELRAHKIRGKTHLNQFPLCNVIWMKTVAEIPWNTISAVHLKEMETMTSWTRMPMSSTTGPTM
jgi:hypothetical protein